MNRGSGSGSGERRGGANLPTLRGYNEALLLDLLRGAGPAGLGRAELAARTGLTPQAVSKIVVRLSAEGLVAEAGRAASTGGKPRTLLRLVPQARHAVGVHLDRDELRAVRVDLAGGVVAESRGPLDFGGGQDAVVEAVVRRVGRVTDAAGPPLLGAGVAAPGPLDHRTGVMGRVTGFPEWEGFPLREVLEGRLGLPVLLDKDTNAGAAGTVTAATVTAETVTAAPAPAPGAPGAPGAAAPNTPPAPGAAAPGAPGAPGSAAPGAPGAPGAAAPGTPTAPETTVPGAVPPAAARPGASVYLHVGTGLGAGLYLDGEVYRGARSAAGEFGHQVLYLDGPPCRCGARGCAEVLCLAAVDRGDLPEAARILGEGAANLVALLDVERVFLGGRVVAAAPEVFVAGVRAVLAARALAQPPPTVALAGAGVAEGAAELVLAPFFGRA
ncbi:ROK family transcriptional regulator [Streptomyces xanthophaeus]|uniref:ROK family transcriptional regulator n=1 Tax=Streptomyces xanthophaeus TaxID=67385 RepID=UPI00342079F2